MYFYIITIIYNQLIKKCAIATKMDAAFPITSIFVDNSTKEDICNENKAFCQKENFLYVNMQGNQGLPKAYNKAIGEIYKDKDFWVIICDQDTEVTSDFIQFYKKAIELNPDKKIFCPVIRDSVGIMSPSKIKGKKFVHSKIMNFNISIENYSFINSCMCINATVFDSVKYDENLFLDCVDHDFVKSVRRTFSDNLFYVITDMEVFQNFSGVTKNSLESDIVRFKIYIKDARYFYSKWYKNTFSIEVLLFLRALKLSFTHKTFVFLRHLLTF